MFKELIQNLWDFHVKLFHEEWAQRFGPGMLTTLYVCVLSMAIKKTIKETCNFIKEAWNFLDDLWYDGGCIGKIVATGLLTCCTGFALLCGGLIVFFAAANTKTTTTDAPQADHNETVSDSPSPLTSRIPARETSTIPIARYTERTTHSITTTKGFEIGQIYRTRIRHYGREASEVSPTQKATFQQKEDFRRQQPRQLQTATAK